MGAFTGEPVKKSKKAPFPLGVASESIVVSRPFAEPIDSAIFMP